MMGGVLLLQSVDDVKEKRKYAEAKRRTESLENSVRVS
jgi:hypothetical protein